MKRYCQQFKHANFDFQEQGGWKEVQVLTGMETYLVWFLNIVSNVEIPDIMATSQVNICLYNKRKKLLKA